MGSVTIRHIIYTRNTCMQQPLAMSILLYFSIQSTLLYMQYRTNCFEILILLYNENYCIRFTVLLSLFNNTMSVNFDKYICSSSMHSCFRNLPFTLKHEAISIRLLIEKHSYTITGCLFEKSINQSINLYLKKTHNRFNIKLVSKRGVYITNIEIAPYRPPPSRPPSLPPSLNTYR